MLVGLKPGLHSHETERKVDTETKLSQFCFYCSELVRLPTQLMKRMTFCVECKPGF